MAPPQGGAFDSVLMAGGRAAPLKFAFTPYQSPPRGPARIQSWPERPSRLPCYRGNGQEWLWRWPYVGTNL